MNKKSFKPGTLLSPLPVIIATCGDMENSNAITIAWTGIINSEPPYTYVSVRKSRFSHDIIKEKGTFVINLVNENLVKAADYCGVKSGRDVDKFKEMRLHKVEGTVTGCPMIEESPINLECRVVEIHEYPSHDMFVGEIVNVNVNEDVVAEDGKIDYTKLGLVSYVHGEYMPLRKAPIGFFGYSVARKKVLKKRNKQAHDRRVNNNKVKKTK